MRQDKNGDTTLGKKMFLCLIMQHARKTYGGEDVWLYAFLTSSLGRGGNRQAPAALPIAKEPPRSHWIGGWVGPRAVLDAVVKSKYMLIWSF